MEAVLKREIIINRSICRLLAVFISVVFISLGAFVRVPLPFTPVPLTLQTFFVLLCAGLLDRRLGIIAQLSYIFLGAIGVPVFTQAVSGISYLFSPTAGYLLGFVLATFFITGFIRYAERNLILTLCVFCVASMLILFCGSLWLKITLGISLVKSLLIGFLPFIPGDLLKASLAAFVYQKLKARVREVL